MTMCCELRKASRVTEENEVTVTLGNGTATSVHKNVIYILFFTLKFLIPSTHKRKINVKFTD